MKTHVNIPIFIPHLGCPNMCVFCNQRAISGVCSFVPEMAEREIETVLGTVRGKEVECEIAFFGGSFTGIDRELMVNLLDIAEKHIASGDVSGIRMSTRPDYINSEIVQILEGYTISAVELGVQSMSDRVLAASRRGCTAENTREAIAMLRDAGFSVVGQMMIGLPDSTPEDEIHTACEICRLGATGARIYPTVVLRETELADMMFRGEYTPLTLDDAVRRSADVLEIFLDAGVDCLRIGLCENENLHSDGAYLAGPNHPSLGELVYGEIYYKKLCRELDGGATKHITVDVPRGEVSKVIGHRKRNTLRIKEKYGIDKLVFKESDDLPLYNIAVTY